MHFSTYIIPSLMAIFVAASPAQLNRRAELRGFDISQLQPSSFWSCAANAGYGKAVIRLYQQACRSGGAIDTNFLASYKAARAGGITNIDGYVFPCTGTQPTGVACKPIETQISELTTYISDNKLLIERLWFDIEPISGTCNAWQLGASANLALAKDWIAALKATGLNWGVYANGNQWSSMFPSRSSDIASDLPLFAVQDDGEPGVVTVDTFMGGWTTAFAKQYSLDTATNECGGSLDLDSFSA